MQNLENDMDDLFKRAAEFYPLQPGSGDWKNIAKRITHEFERPAVVAPAKSKITKKIVALLILVTLSSGWFMFHNTNSGANKLVLTKQTGNRNDWPIKNNNSGIRGDKQSFDISREMSGNNNFREKRHTSAVPGSGKEIGRISYVSDYKVAASKKGEPQNGQVIEKSRNDGKYFSWRDNLKNTANTLPENLPDNNERITVKGVHRDKEVTATELNNRLQNKNNTNTNSKDPDDVGTMKRRSILRQEKGLYIGLLIGPDFSKVRSASFNNTGFDAGLVAGFRLSQKLSFETGIGQNRKNYKSEGKMFNMDKVGPSMSGMVINTLESQSSLIEIPLKIKYNIINGGRSDFFMSCGASAYIMTKEKNHYNVTVNGIAENVVGVYEKNDYGLPAVFNITVGYEHSFSGNIQLRIEPFLKVPLQGMGVGSLPVTSAGVQLGITRSLK